MIFKKGDIVRLRRIGKNEYMVEEEAKPISLNGALRSMIVVRGDQGQQLLDPELCELVP